MKHIKTFESLTIPFTIESEDTKLKFNVNNVISYYTVHYGPFSLDVNDVKLLSNSDYEFKVSSGFVSKTIKVTKSRINKIIEAVQKGLKEIVSKPIDSSGKEFTLRKV